MTPDTALQIAESHIPDSLVGRIHFGDSQVRVPCIVKKIAKDSATLHVFDTGRLPNVFWLSVQELGIHEECQIVDKTKRTATVIFGKAEFHRAGPDLLHKSKTLGVEKNISGPETSLNEGFPKLWVVEDDEDDQFILAEAFRDNNFDCELEFFKDGVEFLEHIKDFELTDQSALNQIIALIDINMPRMDGITTLANLRQNSMCQNLPVMMFSTSESDDDIRKTYELGISAYLPKPNKQEDIDLVVNFIVNFWKVRVRMPSAMAV